MTRCACCEMSLENAIGRFVQVEVRLPGQTMFTSVEFVACSALCEDRVRRGCLQLEVRGVASQ